MAAPLWRGGGLTGVMGMSTESMRLAKIRDIVLISSALVLISCLHYFPLDPHFVAPGTYMVLLRRLYYVPILYSALRFGAKGGLIASIATTVVFIPHVSQSMGGFIGPEGMDNLFDTILYNVVGLTTGLVVDSRRRQTQRIQEVLKLNKKIEERETAIRRMQTYTESILNSISSGVISTDRRGTVVTANPAARLLLSLKEEDIIAQPFSRIFEGYDDLLESISLILADAQTRAMMETKIEAAGRTLTVAVRMSPHRSQGRTAGAVVTLEDLTEVRDLADQLRRAEKLTGLGELVAGVAHEVRNPLGVIRASVQMLDQEMTGECATADMTQMMLQEIDRIDSVVNALLDFGRPSDSQFGAVEPLRLIEEVVLLTNQFARQQRVEIVTRISGELPRVWADQDRLKQVFINLISNAIQAMPHGGRLSIEAAAAQDFLRLAFSDTGTGISAEEQQRIFDPFHTTRAEGSGLGLSIVHRIVDAHNGFITVDSEPGRGATFIVGLPIGGNGECGPVVKKANGRRGAGPAGKRPQGARM